MDIVFEAYAPEVIAASTNVMARSGTLGGIFVSAASSTPTITVYDSATTTTATKIVDTFTPIAGTYYPMPFSFNSGCYVAIGGTVSCTVGVNPS